MGPITLTWLAAIIFSGLVFWGVNVPTGKKTPVIYWVTGFLIVFHLLTQSYLFRVDTSPTASTSAKRIAVEASANFKKFLSGTAVGPGKLHYASPMGWYRIITSSFLHYGWLHLIFNAWFFVLFGHVLEHVFGPRKFLWIIAGGLVIPPALDGFFPVGLSRVDVRFTGGFSGVVYAVMGAYLVCFPNSRAYGAVNYDLRFWAAVMFLILPITMVTRFAGVALTETVIIMGIVAAFLLIQPEHARISSPVITVMLYKLLQDILLLEPAVREVFSNSVWRIGGGFAVGIAGGFILNGTRGWALRWGDNTQEGAKASVGSKTRMSVAKLEAEGRKSPEGARIYLGQRVFVGDAERAIAFYRDVIMPKFPEVALPLQEQMALARLLHFKGYDAEALHAYETLLKTEPLPEEFSLARLKAAELIIKLAPDRSQQARNLLDRFEQGHITMVRDKVEAQRLRAMLPVVEEEYREIQTDDSQSEREQKSDNIYAEVSDKITQGPLRRPRRQRAVKEDEQIVSPLSAGIDAPRVRPRSFLYVPGSSPVSLRGQAHPNGMEKHDNEADLSDAELLKKHWKPLQPTVSAKPTPVSVFDRRIKNARVADEDDKATMYGGSTGAVGDKRAGGRLSHLELVKINTDMPTTHEMPGLYGGLEDAVPSSGQQTTLPLERIRLRREKGTDEPADMPARQSRPRFKAEEKTEIEKLTLEWEQRIQPSAITVDADTEKQIEYGETSPSGDVVDAVKWAILLINPFDIAEAKEFKTTHPALTEKYGSVDLSETSGEGFQPLFMFRNLPDVEKDLVVEAAGAAKLQIHAVLEDDPVLKAEPIEVVGIVATADGVTVKTAYGTRRLAWDEIMLVCLCDIRLTPNSRGLHRYLFEMVVMNGKAQRFQLFERTLSLKGSSLNGQTFSDTRVLLEELWNFATEVAHKSHTYPERAVPPLEFPVFESYAWYNEEILRRLIIANGKEFS